MNKAHHAAVVRIKVMAKLNIAEKRLPQDGRIAISLGGRQAGLRVSTLPTSFGERVVLRLLEKSERVLSLTELGLSREDLQLMHSLVGITHGIVLVTGPHRQRQDHHALCRASGTDRAGQEHPDHRRSC